MPMASRCWRCRARWAHPVSSLISSRDSTRLPIVSVSRHSGAARPMPAALAPLAFLLGLGVGRRLLAPGHLGGDGLGHARQGQPPLEPGHLLAQLADHPPGHLGHLPLSLRRLAVLLPPAQAVAAAYRPVAPSPALI